MVYTESPCFPSLIRALICPSLHSTSKEDDDQARNTIVRELSEPRQVQNGNFWLSRKWQPGEREQEEKKP